MNKVNEFLKHYNYDPVKAHEYYMRTRKLKGRSTRGMSDEQKEAWEYVKDQISTEKKANIKATSDHKNRIIEQARIRAEATRKRISEKLKKMVEETQKASMEKLKEIPKNISPEKRAKLIEERKKDLAKIREEANVEREKTRNDLKSIISSTREAYKQARSQIDSNYEKTYQDEFDKVLSTVKGKKNIKKGSK